VTDGRIGVAGGGCVEVEGVEEYAVSTGERGLGAPARQRGRR
jgi:hypothetical protein